MKQMKKFFGIVLALLLCASCLVISPAAATDDWEMNGTTYATLQAAVDAAPQGTQTTIKLLADGYQWTKTQLKGKNIIIDCDNHTTSGNVELRDKGTVVVKNMTHVSEGDGKLTSQVGECNVTFENCNFTNSSPSNFGMFVVRTALTLKKCVVTLAKSDSGVAMFRPDQATAKLTIENCILDHQGSGAVFANFGDKASVHVSDTKITVNTGWAVNCTVAAEISIDGAETSITSQSDKNPLFYCKDGNLTIDGGTYSSKAPLVQTNSDTAKANIKAGIFATTALTVFQASVVDGVQISDGVVVSSSDRIYHAAGKKQIGYPEHLKKDTSGIYPLYTYLGNPITGNTQLKAFQLSNTVSEDGTFSIRLVGAVDSLDYTNLGFDIVAKSVSFKDGEVTQSKEIDTVYGQLTGIGADDETISYTAKELGGEYIFALIINGLKVDSNPITFTVITYAIKDGDKIAQTPVTFTVVPTEYYPAA